MHDVLSIGDRMTVGAPDNVYYIGPQRARSGILPPDRHILRAARDHTCKQLLAVVMDHLHPDEYEWTRESTDRPARRARSFRAA